MKEVGDAEDKKHFQVNGSEAKEALEGRERAQGDSRAEALQIYSVAICTSPDRKEPREMM